MAYAAASVVRSSTILESALSFAAALGAPQNSRILGVSDRTASSTVTENTLMLFPFAVFAKSIDASCLSSSAVSTSAALKKKRSMAGWTDSGSAGGTFAGLTATFAGSAFTGETAAAFAGVAAGVVF